MANVCRFLGSGLRAFIDPRKSADLRSSLKWICEHVDNAIDAGAKNVGINISKNLYRCVDDGSGISPRLSEPNWSCLFELGNHHNPDGHNRMGQHGWGGKYASLNLTGGEPNSVIRVYTRRAGEAKYKIAQMRVGDIIQKNTDITWERCKAEASCEGLRTHRVGTIVEVSSSHNRLTYLRNKSREIAHELGRIYYKAIQNGLRIVVDIDRPELVRPKPIEYKDGGPEVAFDFQINYANPSDESVRLLGNVHCFFGEASDEFKLAETKNNNGTGVRLVHKSSGRFINHSNLQVCDFVHGYPTGFAGEIILGDITIEDGSTAPDLHWPLSSTKDELDGGVMVAIREFVLEDEGYKELVARLRQKIQSSKLALMSEQIQSRFMDALGEILQEEKKGGKKVYPPRPPRPTPISPDPDAEPKTPWVDDDTPGDEDGDKKSEEKFTRGVQFYFSEDLPKENDLISISPDGYLITVNMNHDGADEIFRPAGICDHPAFQRMLTMFFINHYMAFRPSNDPGFGQMDIDERKDETVGELSKFFKKTATPTTAQNEVAQ